MWAENVAEGGSLQEIQVQQIPNIFTLKEISYCSPPQISRPVSYPPSSQNHFLSTANSPPAITGDLQDTQNTNYYRHKMRVKSWSAALHRLILSETSLGSLPLYPMCLHVSACV